MVISAFVNEPVDDEPVKAEFWVVPLLYSTLVLTLIPAGNCSLNSLWAIG